MDCTKCKWYENTIGCANAVQVGSCPAQSGESQYVDEKRYEAMEREEWADALIDAQEKLGEVIETLEQYARDRRRSELEVYMIAHLKTIAGGMGYRTHNTTLEDESKSLQESVMGHWCELCGCELQSGEERDVGICGRCQEADEEYIAKHETLACK